MKEAARLSDLDVSRSDALVLRSFLEKVAIPELLKGWKIRPEGRCVIVSDRAVRHQFPASEEDLQSAMKGRGKYSDGLKVQVPSFGVPPFVYSPSVPPVEKLIPKVMLEQALSFADETPLPRPDTNSTLEIIYENADTVKKFEDLKTLYPCAVGAFHISLPAYSKDGEQAGVFYLKRLFIMSGIGVFYGDSAFVMMQREGKEWVPSWIVGIWVT
jgi:hypothetical protein